LRNNWAEAVVNNEGERADICFVFLKFKEEQLRDAEAVGARKDKGNEGVRDRGASLIKGVREDRNVPLIAQMFGIVKGDFALVPRKP
jgi:hypothetical protein